MSDAPQDGVSYPVVIGSTLQGGSDNEDFFHTLQCMYLNTAQCESLVICLDHWIYFIV